MGTWRRRGGLCPYRRCGGLIMGKEIIQKDLSREELENFYVMVRSYYPNAVRGVEAGVTGFCWLFGYDESERRAEVHNGSAMILGTDSGALYYVGVGHGRHTDRLCCTKSRKRFMTALRKLSETDYCYRAMDSWMAGWSRK